MLLKNKEYSVLNYNYYVAGLGLKHDTKSLNSLNNIVKEENENLFGLIFSWLYESKEERQRKVQQALREKYKRIFGYDLDDVRLLKIMLEKFGSKKKENEQNNSDLVE